MDALLFIFKLIYYNRNGRASVNHYSGLKISYGMGKVLASAPAGNIANAD